MTVPHHWLDPLPLRGGKSLPNRVLPGPMEGIARRPFCTVMTRRELVRCWITPFVRVSQGVPRMTRLRKRLAPFLDQGLPVVVQLMGTDIPTIWATAERIIELGVAGIDLNCACPSRTVLHSGAGGARLRDPQWLHDALCGLRSVCANCGLSVKLRTGFESPDESDAIFAAVRDASPDLAIVHFRTARELYDPVPNGYDRLARVRELLPDTPLIGSGDLFTVEDAFEMYRIATVDGVAPARGLMRNPWLLTDIEDACNTQSAPRRAGLQSQPTPDRDPVGFLHDLAECGLACGVRSRGFVMELAGWLLGEASPLLAELRQTADLADVTGLLSARMSST